MAAGDFTNIRVEALTWDSVVLRYAYALTGTNPVSVYRSTAGGAYELVVTIPDDYGDEGSPFTDVDLAEQTLYGYKLSDDEGSTFTDAFLVKTQQQFELTEPAGQEIALPIISREEDINVENMQEIANSVQDFLNGPSISAPRECIVCPSDGALILDCANGCFSFTVTEADMADINSISINCDQLQINFEVPEGTEIEICGWPEASGFTGDECFQAPISSPIVVPLKMNDPSPCENTRVYLNGGPCLGDYHYECWDSGSLIRASYRNVIVTDCSCGLIFEGNQSHGNGSPVYTVFSGKQTGLGGRDRKGFAGLSILYKSVNSNCSGVPAAANIVDYNVGDSGAGELAPIFNRSGGVIVGFAVNVPEGVTTRDFTGHVLLFDYPNDRYLWGRYVNADLHAGDYPTTIATLPMSAITPTLINLIIDATGGNIYSLFDVILENSSDTQTMAHTSISLVAEPHGVGLIWVANTNAGFGDYWASVRMYSEFAMYWWG